MNVFFLFFAHFMHMQSQTSCYSTCSGAKRGGKGKTSKNLLTNGWEMRKPKRNPLISEQPGSAQEFVGLTHLRTSCWIKWRFRFATLRLRSGFVSFNSHSMCQKLLFMLTSAETNCTKYSDSAFTQPGDIQHMLQISLPVLFHTCQLIPFGDVAKQ